MKLRDIISDIKSGDWGKDALSDNYTEAVYCIRGADIPNINNGEKRILPNRFIKEKAAKTKSLSNNNLVVEISGGSPTQSTGRIAFISNKLLSHYDKKIICSNFCKVIIPQNINPEYLYYYWKDLYNKGVLFPYENGTTGIKNLDLNRFIDEQDIWNPDPDTQQKIVQILKSLDDKIELNRQINANLEEQAQSLFKSWFVDFEPFRNSPFVDSELGKIPKGWKVNSIEDLASYIASGGTPRSLDSSYYDGDIRWFTTKELKDEFLFDSEKHISQTALKNSAAKLFPENTVLMAIYASPTVGRLGILTAESTCNQAAVGIIAKEEIGYAYLYLLLLSERINLNNLASGAAQQNLNVGIVKRYRVLVPTIDILVHSMKS